MNPGEEQTPALVIDGVEARAPDRGATEADEIMQLNLETLAFRMQCRVDACVERNGTKDAAVTSSGVGISYLLAKELATTLQKAADAWNRRASTPLELAAVAYHDTEGLMERRDAWVAVEREVAVFKGRRHRSARQPEI